MTEKLCLLATLTLLISYTCTGAMTSCSEDPQRLKARDHPQGIVFPNLSSLQTGEDQICSWVISASNEYDVIRFSFTDWFDPDSNSCVVIKDGEGPSSPTLRVICGVTYFHGIVTSTTSSIYVQFNAQIDDGKRGFGLEYWGMHKRSIEETSPQYGAANYVLIVATAAVTLAFLGGLVCLFFREKYREKKVKDGKMKQMLQRRRQGISGISGFDTSSVEPEIVTDATSFVNEDTPPFGVTLAGRADKININMSR